MDTYKSCTGKQWIDCGIGAAGMVPGVGAAAKEAKVAYAEVKAATSQISDSAWAGLKNTNDPTAYNRYLDRWRSTNQIRHDAAGDYYKAVANNIRAQNAASGPYFWQIKQMDQFDRWGNALQVDNVAWNSVACLKYNDCGQNRHETIFSSEPYSRGGGSGGGNSGGGNSGGGPSYPSYNFPIPSSGGGCQNIKVPGGTILC